MKYVFAAAALTTIALTPPALAMSEAECKTEWIKADVNKDGVLTDAEGARYVAAMRVLGKVPAADGKMNEAAFMESCKDGVFAARAIDEGAPLKGANSFTEAQAKDRAMSAGFNNVSTLTKDGDGIWRGTAAQNDKQVSIAIDFKGNVVAK